MMVVACLVACLTRAIESSAKQTQLCAIISSAIAQRLYRPVLFQRVRMVNGFCMDAGMDGNANSEAA